MTTPHAVLEKFPPLARPKSPGLAALIGALTGGIGLAIYFRSLRDLFPVEVAAGLVTLGTLAAGANPLQLEANPLGLARIAVPVVIGGLYGFWRAQNSNRRLGVSVVPAVAVGAVG